MFKFIRNLFKSRQKEKFQKALSSLEKDKEKEINDAYFMQTFYSDISQILRK